MFGGDIRVVGGHHEPWAIVDIRFTQTHKPDLRLTRPEDARAIVHSAFLVLVISSPAPLTLFPFPIFRMIFLPVCPPNQPSFPDQAFFQSSFFVRVPRRPPPHRVCRSFYTQILGDGEFVRWCTGSRDRCDHTAVARLAS